MLCAQRDTPHEKALLSFFSCSLPFHLSFMCATLYALGALGYVRVLSFHSLFFVFIQKRRRARFSFFIFLHGGWPMSRGKRVSPVTHTLGHILPSYSMNTSLGHQPLSSFVRLNLLEEGHGRLKKKKKWMLTLPKRKGGRERGNEEEKIKRDAAHASRSSREHPIQRWLKICQPHQLPTWHVVVVLSRFCGNQAFSLLDQSRRPSPRLISSRHQTTFF